MPPPTPVPSASCTSLPLPVHPAAASSGVHVKARLPSSPTVAATAPRRGKLMVWIQRYMGSRLALVMKNH